MSASQAGDSQRNEQRPVGFARPTNERAMRAYHALEQNRLDDAAEHVNAIPHQEGSEATWTFLLCGMLALESDGLAAASRPLRHAVHSANAQARRAAPVSRRDAVRLAAIALEKIGCIFRRQDRPEEAMAVHVNAFSLRERHGSHEEIWETAVSIGLDADLLRRPESAQRWYHLAIEHGAQSEQEPKRKQATAWGYLAACLLQAGWYPKAIDAARVARDLWHEHDVTDAAAARADMHLGHALLRQGESLSDGDDPSAGDVLDEAARWLSSARESLLAFGRAYQGDARWCGEQLDFLRRLRALS